MTIMSLLSQSSSRKGNKRDTKDSTDTNRRMNQTQSSIMDKLEQRRKVGA